MDLDLFTAERTGGEQADEEHLGLYSIRLRNGFVCFNGI